MEYNNEFEPEIDFKKVLKTPSRWFGYIYIFIMILIIIGGHFYLVNLQDIEMNISEPVAISPPQHQELKMMKSTIHEGINISDISIPNDSMILMGKELYNTSCASCHGNGGKGDGVAGAALNPKPRNFLSKEGWKNGMKISQMYKTIVEGIAGSGMTSYEYLPNKDKFALIHYIRSLRNDFPVDTKEELENLDLEYSLSRGKQTSNQIPVSLAMTKLIDDTEPVKKKADLILSQIIGSNEEGALIFKANSNNYFLSVHYLIQDDWWKSDINKFIDYISQSVADNGFKVGILRLRKTEWQKLFDYLIKIY
jgi:cytochrome c5